jgi:1-acyl-sn-glycerol-3-phosphate acyltransferase
MSTAEPVPAGPRGVLAALLQGLFFALFVKPFMALFMGVRVRGLENLPSREPFVLIANHSSHLDTLALLNLFPLLRLRRIRPVAAADYFERNRAVSWFSHTFFNILPIPRHGFTKENHPVERMKAAVASGQSLLLFPEGTRGSGETPAPFHVGVAALAEAFPEIPIVPAYLKNLGRSLPKGEFLPVPFFCQVSLGAPLHPGGDREAVLKALYDRVLALRDGP